MGSGVGMIGPEEAGEGAGVADFKGRHFTGEVILWAVRWYLMFPVIPIRKKADSSADTKRQSNQ